MGKFELQKIIDGYSIGWILDFIQNRDSSYEVTTNNGKYYLKSYTFEEYLDGKLQSEEIGLIPVKIGNAFIVHKYAKYWRVE